MNDEPVVTKGGLSLTPEVEARLAAEAEAGFDATELVPQEIPEHLQPNVTSRGFKHMPPVRSTYEGCRVMVYESSSAARAALWVRAQVPANLNVPGGEMVDATVHLDIDDAWKLAEQIVFLVQNHYHGPYYGYADPVAYALAEAYQRGVEAERSAQRNGS